MREGGARRARAPRQHFSLYLSRQVERDYLANPEFTPDCIRTKSAAAAGLCSWVANVVSYFRTVQVVAPKRAAAAAAAARLAAANERLTYVRARVAAIRARVAELEGALVKVRGERRGWGEREEAHVRTHPSPTNTLSSLLGHGGEGGGHRAGCAHWPPCRPRAPPHRRPGLGIRALDRLRGAH